MTLETAREFLQQQGLAFTQTAYDSQAAFWQQMCQVPPAAADQSDRVAALELPSNNGRTKLVLEFHETARGALLEDLWFGGYSFELFDLLEESLPEELGRCMAQIMRGELVFVCAYDLKKQMRRTIAARKTRRRICPACSACCGGLRRKRAGFPGDWAGKPCMKSTTGTLTAPSLNKRDRDALQSQRAGGWLVFSRPCHAQAPVTLAAGQRRPGGASAPEKKAPEILSRLEAA